MYRFYKARKQLAAIDWNYHRDRSAAVGSEGGEGRYSRKYNQHTKEWNTYIIKVDKDFAYIPILMVKFFRRQIDILRIDRHVSLSEDDPERIAPAIVHTAPISSKELFERHKRTDAHGHTQYLVCWRGYGKNYDKWVDKTNTNECLKQVFRTCHQGTPGLLQTLAVLVAEKLSMANLCTLHNRQLQDMVVLMYKTKKNICLKYIADLFHMTDTKYSLRNKEFAMPRFNTTTYGKHSIRYIGPKLWSVLLKNIRHLPALSVFRQHIRKFDLNFLLADVHCSDCILCRT